VKNTFIECPNTPAGGMPVPLLSAPAQCAYTLKDSLAAAAASVDEAPQTQPALQGAEATGPTVMVRRKPDPLQYVSGGAAAGLIPIPEGASAAGQVTTATPARSVVANSVPATPCAMQQWECMATPTGTPMAYGAPRQTLSLVSMIQSPKVDSKTMFDAPQMVYQAPGVTAMAPPQYVPTIQGVQNNIAGQTGVGLGQPVTTMPPQVVQYQASQPLSAAPPGPASFAPFHVAPGAAPDASSPPSQPPSQPPMQPPTVADNIPPPPQASPLASVKLGLLSAPQPSASSVTYMTTASAPQGVLQQFPTARLAATNPPTAHLSTTYPMTVPHSNSPVSMAGTTVSPTYAVSGVQATRFVPPPPMAPAPTVLATPAGSTPIPATPLGTPQALAGSVAAAAAKMSTPPAPLTLPGGAAAPASISEVSPSSGGMSPADLKVLTELAVAAGNQQAIEALSRQAQAAGVSTDEFKAMAHQS